MSSKDIESVEFQASTEKILDTLTKITDDHEMRIRRVESIIAYGIGAAGALKLLYDMIAPLIHR